MIAFSKDQVVDKPLLVADNDDVSGGPIKAKCAPVLMVGVVPVSSNHFVLSSITGKTAFRTLGDARMSLPADLFDVGRDELTIEFTVEQNTPTPAQVGLCGSIRNQIPQPVYVAVLDGKLQFRYQLENGTVQQYMVPWPAAGMATGKIVYKSGEQIRIEVNTIPYASTGFQTGRLAKRKSEYFGVGGIADRAYGWGDFVGGPHDWTYHILKYTGGRSSGPQTNETTVPFARILGNLTTDNKPDTGPVHCYGGYLDKNGNYATAHVYGNMLSTTPDQNKKPCRIHDLRIDTSLVKAALISIGGIYSAELERLTINGGGQSIASLGGSWSYPIHLIACNLGSPYWGHGQILWAERTNFQYCGAAFQRCDLSMTKTFVAGAYQGVENLFELREQCSAVFDRGSANFEGTGSGPTGSYFLAESANIGDNENQPPSQLVIRDWKLGEPAAKGNVALVNGFGRKLRGFHHLERVTGPLGNIIQPVADPSWQPY